jgi:hypothetical protein
MTASLMECLADLNDRIDLAEDRRNLHAWIDFLEGRNTENPFVPPARTPRPPTVDWPQININDALEDIDLMVLREFKALSDQLAGGWWGRLNVRSNYGTSIMPCLFGCDLYIMDRATDTLPTALPLHDEGKVRQLVNAGLPDLRTGQGGLVFDCGARFVELMKDFPNIAQAVQIYHPDMQGPIDIAEVVWGSEMFLAVYDNPTLLSELLELVTETYIAFMTRWREVVPPPEGDYTAHWGSLMKGYPMLRNDSLMNLSPETYVEFVRPMDQRIYDAFGGQGGQHFCGRGDHFIEAMSEMKGLSVLAMSQPEYNDMETIFRHTVDQGICLIQFNHQAAEQAIRSGRDLRGRVMTNGQ